MVGEVGSTKEHSNKYSTTFGYRPPMKGGDALLGGAIDVFSKGNAFGATQSMLLAFLAMGKTTLVALPSDSGGTRLLLGGDTGLTGTLNEWVRRDLLGLSTQLLGEVSDVSGKDKLALYDDRLELDREDRLGDKIDMVTIMLDQVKGVYVNKGWLNATLTVHGSDRRIELEKVPERKAEEFKELVRQRIGSKKR
jgi:hypothetical protein